MKKILQFLSIVIITLCLAFVSFGQADVTITVDDQTFTYEKIMFKGVPTSWDTIPMYDDGTHGDEVAGDHIWTVILEQVGEGDNEWGAIEDDGSEWGIWLIQGPNPMFNVTGSVVTGQTSYTIPGKVYMDQCFTVNNENWENIPFTAVSYKGTATGWATILMYDDGTHCDAVADDHIWTIGIADSVSVGAHEWGAVDQDDQWLISGSNVTFNVDGQGNVTGDTNYTIPAWGDVPVTFRVNLNCQLNAAIYFTLDSCLDLYMDGFPPVLLNDHYVGYGDYEVTVARFNVGDTLNYKYRIGCRWGPEEQQEYPGPHNNREWVVVLGSNVIPEVWYQDDILPDSCEWQSIAEYGEDMQISIYPNPANEVLHVDIINLKAVDKVIITNMLGQTITTIKDINESMEIPVFDYNKGIYFITILGNNGGKYTEKIVIH